MGSPEFVEKMSRWRCLLSIVGVLLLCASMSLCSKRSLHQTSSRGSGPASKRAKKEPIFCFSAAYIPQDLLMEIFNHFLYGLRLKRTLFNPILPALQVSKYWSVQLQSKRFLLFLLSHPVYAYLYLKVSFDLSVPNGLVFLQSAAPIISVEAGIRLLFNARDIHHIRELKKIPAFQRSISTRTLNMALSYGRRHNHLTTVVPDIDDLVFEFNPRDHIVDFFDSKSKWVLQTMPLLEIIKLMFLENIHDQLKFSYIYEFACWEIFWAYFTKTPSIVKPLVDALHNLFPLGCDFEALPTVMSRPMVDAMIVGDRNFFYFLEVDLDLCASEVFGGPEVIAIMRQFVGGTIEYYPADQLILIKEFLKESRYYEEYTYPRKLFELRKRQMLEDPDLSEANKALARKYL